jgi:hypothetical protein
MAQGRREQVEPKPPKFPRYEPSIRVLIVFFAAVLGFGLKNLLDTPPAKNPVWEIPLYKGVPWEIYTHKWLLFLVATFIFLRFLTGSANHLWLEFQKYEIDYRPQDDGQKSEIDYRPQNDGLLLVGFFWVTLFGCLGAFLCYAGNPSQFFGRAVILLSATLLGSGSQWLWRARGRTSPIGQWGDWWTLVNGIQLVAVVVLWCTGVLGWSWGTRLLFLAFVSVVILIVDFYWQLMQVAKGRPQQEPAPAPYLRNSAFVLLLLVLLVLALLASVLFALSSVRAPRSVPRGGRGG